MFLFVGIGAKKIVKGPILYIILGFILIAGFFIFHWNDARIFKGTF